MFPFELQQLVLIVSTWLNRLSDPKHNTCVCVCENIVDFLAKEVAQLLLVQQSEEPSFFRVWKRRTAACATFDRYWSRSGNIHQLGYKNGFQLQKSAVRLMCVCSLRVRLFLTIHWNIDSALAGCRSGFPESYPLLCSLQQNHLQLLLSRMSENVKVICVR